MIYSCLIVDDEPLSHQVLKNHLDKFSNLEVKAGFFNAKDANEYLTHHTIDILFLDIQMPGTNGLDFLKSLPVKPVTIISTAYRNFAVEGFDLGVMDYLLKPISFGRFEMAMKRAMDFLQLVNLDQTIEFQKKLESQQYEIMIKTGTKKVLIDYRKIIYAQGLKDYTILYTNDKRYVVKGSVKTFEDFLPTGFFMRVHKSFIIAKNQIRVVHKNKIELEQLNIPVGRLYKEQVDEYLRKWRGGNNLL